jgi:hypothetical protein
VSGLADLKVEAKLESSVLAFRQQPVLIGARFDVGGCGLPVEKLRLHPDGRRCHRELLLATGFSNKRLPFLDLEFYAENCARTFPCQPLFPRKIQHADFF